MKRKYKAMSTITSDISRTIPAYAANNRGDRRMNFDNIDRVITRTLGQHGLMLLRYSVGVIFIWFGGLKLFGASPAAELVKGTVPWLDPAWFLPFLAIWEVVIGMCFL